MKEKDIFIYKSSGIYLGFIRNGYLYSRDGVFLGWLDNEYVWDSNGQFRGTVIEFNNNRYVLTKRFMLNPAPRSPKHVKQEIALPNPPSNISPISLPIEYIDSF